MIKKAIPIWLIGLIIWGSTSGLFTVICHGADGHIGLEPATHSHCDCPETDKTSSHESGVGLSNAHDHCTDSTATSTILTPIRKSGFSFPDKIFTLDSILKSIAPCTSSILNYCAVRGYDLSSFHTPLQTIVLLA
jgi:hypothetical protein